MVLTWLIGIGQSLPPIPRATSNIFSIRRSRWNRMVLFVRPTLSATTWPCLTSKFLLRRSSFKILNWESIFVWSLTYIWMINMVCVFYFLLMKLANIFRIFSEFFYVIFCYIYGPYKKWRNACPTPWPKRWHLLCWQCSRKETDIIQHLTGTNGCLQLRLALQQLHQCLAAFTSRLVLCIKEGKREQSQTWENSSGFFSFMFCLWPISR